MVAFQDFDLHSCVDGAITELWKMRMSEGRREGEYQKLISECER
jgi:hypothetical protein